MDGSPFNKDLGQIGPLAAVLADSRPVRNRYSRHGELIASPLGGAFYEQASRGNVWGASAAAVTVPANANNLVSVFAIHNPPNSGRNVELIDFDAINVLATTVVSGIGLYFSTAALTALATFTTPGTIQPAMIGVAIQNQLPQAQFYSALTHSGTPALHTLLGGWGATTALAPLHYEFKGRAIIPPGIAVSVAMTTAAGTASGITLGLSWAERPI